MDRPLRIGGVAAALVIALVVVAASSRPVQLWVVGSSPGAAPAAVDDQPDDTQPASDDKPEQHEDKPFPAWVADVVQVVMIAISMAAAIAVLVWLGRRHRIDRRSRGRTRAHHGAFPEPLPEIADLASNLEHVDFGAAHLALTGGDPTEAIIACWLQLEHDAAAAGVERRPHETSAEYAARVIAEASVDPAPIGELAALYREARFSRHQLGDVHRQRAREALARVEGALRHSAGATR